MDYNKSMGKGSIPGNKVNRPMNRWCYKRLDPVFWGENRPTGRYYQICENTDVIYVCMLIILKNDRGKEITRMLDAEWISCIFEATHIDAQIDRVQDTHLIDPWGYTTIEWLKNRMIKKYQDMRMHEQMIGTDDEIKLRAV
jgi:hypothetical protein